MTQKMKVQQYKGLRQLSAVTALMLLLSIVLPVFSYAPARAANLMEQVIPVELYRDASYAEPLEPDTVVLKLDQGDENDVMPKDVEYLGITDPTPAEETAAVTFTATDRTALSGIDGEDGGETAEEPAPAEETPAPAQEEAPAEETPAAEEAPTEETGTESESETPAQEEIPAEETETESASETPAEEEAPAEETETPAPAEVVVPAKKENWIELRGMLPVGAVAKAFPVRRVVSGVNYIAGYDIRVFLDDGSRWYPTGALRVILHTDELRIARRLGTEMTAWNSSQGSDPVRFDTIEYDSARDAIVASDIEYLSVLYFTTIPAEEEEAPAEELPGEPAPEENTEDGEGTEPAGAEDGMPDWMLDQLTEAYGGEEGSAELTDPLEPAPLDPTPLLPAPVDDDPVTEPEKSSAAAVTELKYLDASLKDADGTLYTVKKNDLTKKVAKNAPDGMEVLEAYRLKKSDDYAYVVLTLSRLAKLGAGEYFALYGVDTANNTLYDTPANADMRLGDTETLSLPLYKGFALVKVSAPVEGNNPILYPEEGTTLQLSGDLPVGGSFRAEPVTTGAYGAILAYSVTVLDASGNVYQPGKGDSVEILIRNAAIAEAMSKGLGIGVLRVREDGATEILRNVVVTEDTVIFNTTALSTFIITASQWNNATETIYVGQDFYLTGKMPKNAVVEAIPVQVEIEGQQVLTAYDIKIYANEKQREKGKTWQPAGDKVQVHFYSDALNGVDSVNIYHLSDAKSGPEFTTTVRPREGWVAFEAGSFSVYAASTTLEKIIEATDGNTYKITVTYDDKSGIPTDAELIVSELDDAAAGTYLTATAKTLGVKLSDLSFTKLFDISIEKDGQTYQPTREVKVTVELLQSGANEISNVRVVHFGAEPEKLNAATEGATVTFRTEGFSLFSLVDFNLLDRVVEAVLGSREGTLYENDDIRLTGRMPALGMVEATPVNTTVNGVPALVAYDINIYANPLMRLLGIKWQPTEGAVQVRLKSDAFAGRETVKVYHIPNDSGVPELVDTVAVDENDAITFAAESFSIYPIVEGDEGENARIGYRFWYNDGSQNILLSTQYFRYKDVHPGEGSPQLSLHEPSIPGIDGATWARIFRGWSKTDFKDSDENLMSIVDLNTELSGLAEGDYHEGEYTDLYANLRNVYYITYVDVNPNNVLATEIVPVADSGDTTFTIKTESELHPTVDSDTILQGWYDLEDPSTVYEPGQTGVVVTKNTTLYPKIAGGFWLIFNDNDPVWDTEKEEYVSGGASFTAPVFYLNEVTEEPPIPPIWDGYEFDGWYEARTSNPYTFGNWDISDADKFTFGNMLTKDTTLYAKWNPTSSAYRIVIWKQRTTDAVGLSDDEKNYDYIYSDLMEDAVTGEIVTLPDSYKTIYNVGGSSTDADKNYFQFNAAKTDTSTVVKAGGSSVLNVYYDRKEVTLNFYTWDYTYTETTANNGTQYALVDGEYIQLTRNGNTWTYVSGTEIVYNEYTGNNSGYYYIPDGNGGYTQVYLYRYNGGWYRTRSGWWNYTYSDQYFGTVYTRTERDITETYTGTRYTRSNNRSWKLYKSFTGLYGSTLEGNGYEWPSEYDWYSNGSNNGNTSGTRTTFMSAFLPTDVDTSGSTVSDNFYGSASTGSRYIHFLIQELSGEYTEKETVATSGGGFYITDKYVGFHAYQYRADNGNWNSVGTKNSSGYYNNGNTVSYTNNLYIRFNRNEYTLTFYTNNGSNQLIENTVKYEAPLSTYEEQSPGQRRGYYFLGWYADPSCSQEFDFSQTMPDSNIAIYGKWLMRRVRVVVEPGADNVYMGSQAARFRVNYDERIDGGLLETAQRVGYILAGWYTDPEFTNRFLFSNPINDETSDIAWNYQEQEWKAIREAYGDDDEEHQNVRGILHLYAKWILDTSSKGIYVVYDPGEAAIYNSLDELLTTVPVDTHMYGFEGTATAREAPSNYSDMYTFKYWEGVTADGEVLQFYPSHPIDLKVLRATDTVYDDNGEELRHSVTLRAVYELVGDPARQTNITYDGNTFTENLYNGTEKEMRGKTRDGTNRETVTLDKEVNQTIDLPTGDDFYLDGWTLVGWSFWQGTKAAQDSALAAYNEQHPDNPLTMFTPGQQVAADNLNNGPVNTNANTLYAVWEPKNYTVTVKQIVEAGVPVQNFAYAYKTGVEREIASVPEKVETLDGTNVSFTEDSLTNGGLLEYYDRTGHIIRIKTPVIPEDANYSVRVNAVVTKDDGTTEILNPTAAGDYQILGDVVITYTYSLKVLVKLQKRDATDHAAVLTGAEFALTPVEFNTHSNQWENAGSGITAAIDSATFERYLQEGTYRISETAAPTDYTSIGTDLYLTVRKDGAFTLFTSGGGAVNAAVAELDGTGQILTIYDKPIRTITLTKQVEGTDGNFEFTVTIYDEDNVRLSSYTIGEFDGQPLKTNNIGEAILTLSHGDSVELKIPYGCRVIVSEAFDSLYETRYQWEPAAGSVENAEGREFTLESLTVNGTLTFINRHIPAPTGFHFDQKPYFLMLTLGTVLLLLALAARANRYRREAAADTPRNMETDHPPDDPSGRARGDPRAGSFGRLRDGVRRFTKSRTDAFRRTRISDRTRETPRPRGKPKTRGDPRAGGDSA